MKSTHTSPSIIDIYVKVLNLYNWGTDTMCFKLLILNNKIHVCTHTTIFSFISLNGLFLLSWTFG